MTQKTFNMVASVIFAIIAVLHLLRAVYGWPATINGFEVPLWLSWVALVVAGYLSYQACRLSKK